LHWYRRRLHVRSERFQEPSVRLGSIPKDLCCLMASNVGVIDAFLDIMF
jgi:hypothetical protein